MIRGVKNKGVISHGRVGGDEPMPCNISLHYENNRFYFNSLMLYTSEQDSWQNVFV